MAGPFGTGPGPQPGVSGTSGASGVGTSGVSGYSGKSGVGTSGASGTSGVSGAAGGGGSTGTASILLASQTVHTDTVGTQTLYTVPASRKAVVTLVVMRNASTSLAAMIDSASLDFNVDGTLTGFSTALLQFLTDSNKQITKDAVYTELDGGGGWVIGTAGHVLTISFNDTSITATVTVDVFGYLTLTDGTPVANINVP